MTEREPHIVKLVADTTAFSEAVRNLPPITLRVVSEPRTIRRPCDCPTEHAEGDWQLEGRDHESEPGDD